MIHYHVIVTWDTGRKTTFSVAGASIWHAIDKTYTKWFATQPDRTKYKGLMINQ